MLDAYAVARKVQATPKRLFESWLDSREHSDMTGAKATVGSGAGDAFSTFDALVTGTNLEIEPYHRIVQSWKTAGPQGEAVESRVEITFITGPNYGGELPGSPAESITIKVRHVGLPPDQTLFHPGWWEDRYFSPMDAYFAQGDNRFMRPTAAVG